MCEAMRTWACRPAALECRGPAFPVDALKTWSASLTEMWPFETSTWGAAVSARERAGPRERRRGPYLVPRADDHHGRPQEQPGVYEHEKADADDPHARLDDFPQADPLPPERPPQRPAGRRCSHFAPPLAPRLAPVDPQPPACPPWEVGHLSLAHLPRPVPPSPRAQPPRPGREPARQPLGGRRGAARRAQTAPRRPPAPPGAHQAPPAAFVPPVQGGPGGNAEEDRKRGLSIPISAPFQEEEREGRPRQCGGWTGGCEGS